MQASRQQTGGTGIVLGAGGVLGAAWTIGALAALRERWGRADAGADLDALAERVVAGAVDPYAAADELLADGQSFG